jgi:hypothetical protein
LIEESASPLKAVETCFAADSSGFSTSRFERWYDAKYGKIRSERQWVKVHLMIGVKTNIVTSVEITDSDANDSPYLKPLAQKTAERFTMEEVSADKGYISNKNLAAIVALNATPYIPFKVNTTGRGRSCGARCTTSICSSAMSLWWTLCQDTILAQDRK